MSTTNAPDEQIIQLLNRIATTLGWLPFMIGIITGLLILIAMRQK